MKKYLFYSSLCIILLSLTSAKKCTGDSEYEAGVKKLREFTLIKDYRISLEKGKKGEIPFVSFPITLNSGFRYKFYAINNSENKSKIIMSIFATPKKEILIATTYNGTHYEKVEFECKSSGTFYLTFQFENGAEGCAVGFLSVMKK